jgi:YD repeat-containing protein
VTGAGGGNYLYAYDSRGNLLSVIYPDSRVRTYHYGEADLTPSGSNLQSHLTGITDENNNRYASYEYANNGLVLVTRNLAGGTDVNRYAFSYPSSGSASVTDPLGEVRTLTFAKPHGVSLNNGIGGAACPACGPMSQTFDSNGNVSSRTDWNGNRTNYTHDLARNLELSRTEGLTSSGTVTPQTRTITTEWHSTWRLPARIAEPKRITTFVYHGDSGVTCGAPGALCSKTVQATDDATGAQGFGATPVGQPRTWTYTHNANGQALTVDGPRSDVADVTTYTYYPNDDPDLGKPGNVASITNALGPVTQITAYSAHGQPLTIVDPNGLVTTLAYDLRQLADFQDRRHGNDELRVRRGGAAHQGDTARWFVPFVHL